jgi:esterase/lipase superfamily enzyme
VAQASSFVMVGWIAPESSGKAVREALEGTGARFVWARGAEAWKAEVLLWVVEVAAGISEGTRERFRAALEMREAPPLVVYLAGADPAEAARTDILELGVRDLLADLGLNAEAVPVLRGTIRELARELRTRGARKRGRSFTPEAREAERVSRGTLALMEPEAVIVPVFYGTDRARTGRPEPARFFGGRRGELSFGSVEVSLPTKRHKGEMPTPSSWKFWQLREDPSRFVLLLSVTPLEREPFAAGLRQAVEKAEVPEALVFVHGFNVGFAEAAERAAQVAVDLQFPGVPVVYSWPSEGKVQSYTVDEANVEWSAPHFEEFLRLVLAESGARTVHVIAHSMGNRALVRALSSLQAETAGGWARLRQIVFAAPDVDRDTFVEIAHKFHDRAERFTLYGSSNDRALQVSKLVHGYPRAGDSGEDMALVAGIDSIDASESDTSLLGHSYYGSRRPILEDISYLLRRGLPPDQRFGLKKRERRQLPYWVYQP